MVGGRVDRNMSRCMDGSTILFSSIWIVYVLWGSMRLFMYSSMISSVGFVGGYFDCWGIAVFDNLMTTLVGQSNSQKAGYCDENLNYRMVLDRDSLLECGCLSFY